MEIEKMNDFDGFEVVVTQIDADTWEAYLAEVPDIRSRGLTGPSVKHAIASLGVVWECEKQYAYKRDDDVPIPMKNKEYSGMFNTRIDKNLHKMLVIEAFAKGISLNALVCNKLKNSIKKLIDWSEIKLVATEVDETRGTVTIFFANRDDDKIGISFMLSNFDEEISAYRTHKGLDQLSKSLIELADSQSFREAVQKFLDGRILKPSVSHIPLLEAFLICDKEHFSIYRVV